MRDLPLGNGGQLLDLLNLGLALGSLERLGAVAEEGLIGGVPRVLGDAIVVLAGELGGSRGERVSNASEGAGRGREGSAPIRTREATRWWFRSRIES
jgi:hypothetical protein